MTPITPLCYQSLATLLSERCTESFFNGSVEYNTDEFTSKLTCTLIVCRDPQDNSLLSILPVWWEYHLHTSEGEVVTDFDWLEFDRYLMQRSSVPNN